MRSWMIRHHDFTFTRPMLEPELIQKIESGEVTAHDEIAPNDGYWFSIQEVEEVKKYFGENIRLQALIPHGIETTSSTNTALLAPSFTAGKSRFADKPGSRLETPKIKIIVPEVIEKAGSSRFFFGLTLVAIFLGTLLLLWMGSQ